MWNLIFKLLWELACESLSLLQQIPFTRRQVARHRLERMGVPCREEELVFQVRADRLDAVELLLIAGITANALDHEMRLALVEAASLGSLEMVSLLLEHKAEVNPKSQPVSPLMAAVAGRHDAVAKRLREAGAREDGLADVALLQAAREGATAAAEKALDAGARIDARDLDGRTPLLAAAEHGSAAVVDLLLGRPGGERPELVEAADRQGRTALISAAERGHAVIVERLLEAHADPNAATRDEKSTALHLATAHGHAAVVCRLAGSPGILVNQPDGFGRTALDLALGRGDREIGAILQKHGGFSAPQAADLLEAARRGDTARVEALVAARADLNVRDADGQTALMIAAGRGWTGIVTRLASSTTVGARNPRSETALHLAAAGGHEEAAEALLAAGAEVDVRDADGDTPLVLAAARGRASLVRRLLARRADPNGRGAGSTTPLVQAVAAGSLATLRALLDGGADADLAVPFGHAPWMTARLLGRTEITRFLDEKKARRGRREAELFAAAQRGDAAAVRELLRLPVAVEARDLAGRTALMQAAEAGHEEVVRALLDRGAEADAAARDGATPLALAAAGGWTGVMEILLDRPEGARALTNALLTAVRHGQAEAVRVLLDHGADVNARSGGGDPPLVLAAGRGHLRVVDVLLKQPGVAIDAAGRRGLTALMAAILEGHQEIVARLAACGARAGACEANLLAAAQRGDGQRVRDLLAGGADPLARDSHGRTAFAVACERGDLGTADTILAQVADAQALVDAADRGGRTPLMAAASGGHEKLVGRLLDRGAVAEARSEAGRTALMEAARGGHEAFVRRLAGAVSREHLDLADETGATALFEALAGGHAGVATFLESAGATEGRAAWRLFEAARHCDLETLRALLGGVVDFGLRGAGGRTMLMEAAAAGCTDGLRLLAESGAAVGDCDGGGHTALHLAAAEGQSEAVSALLALGAGPDVPDRGGSSPLAAAALHGHLGAVEALLKGHANPNSRDRRGRTPLMLAADAGHARIVEALARQGADVDAADREGRTALLLAHLDPARADVEAALRNNGARAGLCEADLLLAAEGGDAKRVRELLAAKPDLEARNAAGSTALGLAARRGHEAIAALLLDHGASADARDHGLRSPLHEVADAGTEQEARAKVVRRLLAPERVTPDACDHRGDTPLILAARHGAREVAEALLEKAKVDATSRSGETPLMVASGSGHHEMVQLLLGNGASIAATSAAGRTALMQAAGAGHDQVTELLADRLRGRTDLLDAVDHAGFSAWNHAAAHPACQKILEKHGARTGFDPKLMVAVTRTGDCYHHDGCTVLSQAGGAVKSDIRWLPVATAEAEAYRLCELCRDRSSKSARPPAQEAVEQDVEAVATR